MRDRYQVCDREILHYDDEDIARKDMYVHGWRARRCRATRGGRAAERAQLLVRMCDLISQDGGEFDQELYQRARWRTFMGGGTRWACGAVTTASQSEPLT